MTIKSRSERVDQAIKFLIDLINGETMHPDLLQEPITMEKVQEMIDAPQLSVGLTFYAVATENDCDYQGARRYGDSEPILFETNIRTSTLKDAVARASSCGQYGKKYLVHCTILAEI